MNILTTLDEKAGSLLDKVLEADVFGQLLFYLIINAISLLVFFLSYASPAAILWTSGLILVIVGGLQTLVLELENPRFSGAYNCCYLLFGLGFWSLTAFIIIGLS